MSNCSSIFEEFIDLALVLTTPLRVEVYAGLAKPVEEQGICRGAGRVPRDSAGTLWHLIPYSMNYFSNNRVVSHKSITSVMETALLHSDINLSK
jgi:hypothetical protein